MPHSQNPPEFLVDAPARPAPLTFAFAHGAGAPMDTPFLSFFATGLAAHGLRLVRFEFPYMARRRSESGTSPPDRQTGVRETRKRAIAALETEEEQTQPGIQSIMR